MATICSLHVNASDKPKLQVIGFSPNAHSAPPPCAGSHNCAGASPRSVLDPEVLESISCLITESCGANPPCNHGQTTVTKPHASPRSVLGSLLRPPELAAEAGRSAGAGEEEGGEPGSCVSKPIPIECSRSKPPPPRKPAGAPCCSYTPAPAAPCAKSIFSTGSPFVSPPSSAASAAHVTLCSCTPDVAVDDPAMNFLGACFLCKRVLAAGKDIYMYRGDRAFCSSECRYHQILLDER